MINSRPKPLAMYIFSEDELTQAKFLRETSSGGLVFNDTLMHLAMEQLPFGGVGDSGMGAYHGKYGFDTFTHYKVGIHNELIIFICKESANFKKMRPFD